jgi:transcription elongation GreA/GreB family factor
LETKIASSIAESPIGRALRDAELGRPVEVETPKGVRTFVVQKLV